MFSNEVFVGDELRCHNKFQLFYKCLNTLYRDMQSAEMLLELLYVHVQLSIKCYIDK